MRKTNVLIIVILSVAFSAFFPGCVTDTASLKIEKTLPQSKLAYYNDSFDNFRTDLWEKAGYIPNEAQKANFKLAKMGIRDGKLWVQTETGCFSKGGLGSKYVLRGNFDIQVDCQIDFLEGVYDMDQLLALVVIEREKELKIMNLVSLYLCKKGGRNFNTIFSGFRKDGNFHRGDWHKIKNFNGALRIVRIGDRISTLLKKEGDAEWEKMDTFRSTPNDVMIGFSLSNFIAMRNSITAKSPITATFDNFRINAAEEIIEEEI
jgi:hypothetical protein